MAGEGEEVQLLNFWASPYGMRVLLALAAKGVSYSTIPQELGPASKSPLLLQSNPVYGKVPVLLHKGRPICESLVICEYVDEAFPASSEKHDLLPKDPYLRANARFWADYVDKKVFQSFLKPMLVPREEFGSAIEEFQKHLAILEDAFVNDGPLLGGHEVGYLDIVLGPLVPCLSALEAVTNFKWDFDKFPKFQAWKQAFSECPLASCLPDPSKITEAAKNLRQFRFPEAP